MDASYFFTQFAAYNTDWLFVQVVLWLLLAGAVAAVFLRPENSGAGVFLKAALALVFLWNGIVFFLMYMTVSALFGGVPMIAAGILFAVDIKRDRIHIALPASGRLRYATIAWAVWALGLYTIAGWLSGHFYPAGPLPVAPCPTTILAIALLATSMATLRTDRRFFCLLSAMLLWWAFFAGIFAPLMYGFWVDITLLAAGVYGLGMILLNRREG